MIAPSVAEVFTDEQRASIIHRLTIGATVVALCQLEMERARRDFTYDDLLRRACDNDGIAYVVGRPTLRIVS